MARNFIQKLGYKILKYVFPEIIVLRRNLNWENLAKNLVETTVGNNVNIGKPANISESKIGDYSFIAMNSMISLTEIGKFCSIGPNLLCGWGIHPTNGISTAPMFYSTLKQNGVTLSNCDKIDERKHILIGNDVFIGANVTILDGVKIGDGAVIGAGAVVSKDIPPYAIAVGVPIRIVKYRIEHEQIDKMLKIEWWNFDQNKLKSVEEMFFKVDEFIEKYYTL